MGHCGSLWIIVGRKKQYSTEIRFHKPIFWVIMDHCEVTSPIPIYLASQFSIWGSLWIIVGHLVFYKYPAHIDSPRPVETRGDYPITKER